MSRLADLDPDDMVMAAAWLTDQVGEAAVRAARGGIRIRPPAPGDAVLACRCGRVLDAADMRRVRQPRTWGATPAIERIVCKGCAALAVTVADVLRDVANEGRRGGLDGALDLLEQGIPLGRREWS